MYSWLWDYHAKAINGSVLYRTIVIELQLSCQVAWSLARYPDTHKRPLLRRPFTLSYQLASMYS